jgi:hypothetical protein
MPWRGPAFPGEFPTLGYLVADWIEDSCAIPDRHVAGDPFRLSDEQLEHLLWEYRLHPDAVFDPNRPSAPFVYVGNVLIRSQKWGKGPFSAARICAQAAGPVLFAGWDADGEPVGRPWPTPHVQVTAASEDQTKNIWRALTPMIELGAIGDVIEDTGQQSIYLPSGGVIERVTSAALSRLGARITYVEQDQTESYYETNGRHELADTQRRNLAGTGGRWSATANAWDPSENSQAQIDCESRLPDVYVNYPDAPVGSWMNMRDRRRIVKAAYKGAPWVDIDRILSECARLDAKKDPGQAERFYGNRIVAGSSKAFDIESYKELEGPAGIEPGRLVALGFDGALFYDATGLVATDVETGHQVVVAAWRRPTSLSDEAEWQVPIDEVNEAVDFAMEHWKVWRLYGDPPHYREDMARWAGRYEDQVVEWWTNNRKKMAYSLKAFRNDMRPDVMSHGPLNDSREAHANHDALIEHIGNAVRRSTNIRDEEDGTFLWLISKDGQKSPRKIDLAMAACLSWEARTDAIKAGALNEPTYARASWR